MKKLNLFYDQKSNDSFDKILCEKLKELGAEGEPIALYCYPRECGQLELNFNSTTPAKKPGGYWWQK
jgi:hypothetical protein